MANTGTIRLLAALQSANRRCDVVLRDRDLKAPTRKRIRRLTWKITKLQHAVGEVAATPHRIDAKSDRVAALVARRLNVAARSLETESPSAVDRLDRRAGLYRRVDRLGRRVHDFDRMLHGGGSQTWP